MKSEMYFDDSNHLPSSKSEVHVDDPSENEMASIFYAKEEIKVDYM